LSLNASYSLFLFFCGGRIRRRFSAWLDGESRFQVREKPAFLLLTTIRCAKCAFYFHRDHLSSKNRGFCSLQSMHAAQLDAALANLLFWVISA
jgi:hypothetical protein